MPINPVTVKRNKYHERTRACFFGLVWGCIMDAAFVASDAVRQYPTHFREPHHSPHDLLLGLAFGWLFLTPFGVVLAIPSTIASWFYGKQFSENPSKLTWLSVLVSAVWGTIPFVGFILLDKQSGPDGWFGGETRVALAGYISMLLSTYMVGRILPPSSVIDATYAHRNPDLGWLILLISVLWAVAVLLFPILIKAR